MSQPHASTPVTPPPPAGIVGPDELAAYYLAAFRDTPVEPAVLPLPVEAMVELAVLPMWSTSDAVELGVLHSVSAAKDVAALRDAGMLDSRPAPETPSGELHTLRHDGRVQIRDAAQLAMRPPQLIGLLDDLLSRLPTSGAWSREPVMRGWAKVVNLITSDPTGGLLLRVVEGSEPNEANLLVETAAPIADVVGARLPLAVERGRGLVSTLYRKAADAKALEKYQSRPELERQLANFVVGADTDHWALHLLGDGGSGKTMLLRLLSSGQLAKRTDTAPVHAVTVDFDHIDPRYPYESPLLLLEALAVQLKFPADASTTRITEVQQRFIDESGSAIDAASAGPVSLDHEAVVGGIAAFADLVALVGQPVALVLDTTEELAKAYKSSTTAPAVLATVRLLDRVRVAASDRGAQVRVVFAGRRPLFAPDDAVAPESAKPIPQRPHVLLVEGFRREEADTYLARELPDVDTDRAALILKRTRPTSGIDGELRYNPFELSIWVTWIGEADEQGGIDVASIPASADPYVERRILARVSEDQVRILLLPAVMLGTFDAAVLRPTMSRAGIDPMESIQALAKQEWIRVLTRDADGIARLQVEEHLQDRLRQAALAQPANFPLDRDSLGADVRSAIRDAEIRGQEPQLFGAAARLLAPSDAIAFWRELEGKLAAERAWDVFAQLLPGVTAVAIEEAHHLLPYVEATVAAVASQRGMRDVRLWQAVEGNDDPTLAARRRLAIGPQMAPVSATDIEAAPIGSVAAALWRLLDHPHALTTAWSTRTWFWSAVDRLASSQQPAASAIAALAALAAVPDRRDEAQESGPLVEVRQAGERLATARRAGLASFEPEDWVDFTPPTDLAERCLLGWLHAVPAPAVEQLQVLATALLDDGMADGQFGEQFGATLLAKWLEQEPVVEHYLNRFDASRASKPLRPMSADAVTAGTRLVDAVARGYATLGLPERADAVLRRELELAVSANDSLSVLATQRMMLWLFRRFRLPSLSWAMDVSRLDYQDVHSVQLFTDAVTTADESVPTAQPDPIDDLNRLEWDAVVRQPGPQQLLAYALDARSRRDLVAADMAALVATLACARAGDLVPAQLRQWALSSTFFRTPTGANKWQDGWARRAALAQVYLRDGKAAYDAALLPADPFELRPGVVEQPPAVPAAAVPSGSWSQYSASLSRSGGTSMSPPTVIAADSDAPPVRKWRRTRFRVRGESLLYSIIASVVFAVVAMGIAYGISAGSLLWTVPVVVLTLATILALTIGTSRTGPDFLDMYRLLLSITADGDRHVRIAASSPDRYSGLSTKKPPPKWFRRGRIVKGTVSLDIRWSGVRAPDGLALDLSGWRLPTSETDLVLVELDLDGDLDELPWERWIRGSAGAKAPMLWVRRAGDWPHSGLAGAGRLGYAGPQHLANNRLVIFDLDAPSVVMHRAVHVVGTPVQTSAGWRLRVDRPVRSADRPVRSVDRPVPSSSSSSSSKSAPPPYVSGTVGSREGLVAPSQLASERTGVVVLQASPIDAGAESLDDRRPGWIALAREVISAGAAAAIVVPPLNDEAAAQAVDISTAWAVESSSSLTPIIVVNFAAELRRLVDSQCRTHAPKVGPQDDLLTFLTLLPLPLASP
jgi:hypothetical protein